MTRSLVKLLVLLAFLSDPLLARTATDDLVAVCRTIQSSAPLQITSTLSISVTHAGETYETKPVEAVVTIVGPGESSLQIGEYTAFVSDGSVIVVRKDVDDSYLRLPAGSQPAEVIHRVIGLVPFPMVALAMSTEEQPAGIVSQLHSEIEGLELTSSKKDDQGRLVSLALESGDGTMTMAIDPSTGRPMTAALDQQQPEGMPESSTLQYRWKWDYVIPSSEEIPSFVRGNRFRVDRLSSLRRMGEQVASVGGQAPKLDLPTLDGNRVNVASLKGRVVVIDFWATWCGPCRKALPQLQALAEEFKNQPVSFLTVDCFERTSGEQMRAKVAEAAEALGLTLPILLDADGQTARRWGVKGIPATFIINQDGGLAASHSGAGPDYAELLRGEIVELLSPEP